MRGPCVCSCVCWFGCLCAPPGLTRTPLQAVSPRSSLPQPSIPHGKYSGALAQLVGDRFTQHRPWAEGQSRILLREAEAGMLSDPWVQEGKRLLAEKLWCPTKLLSPEVALKAARSKSRPGGVLPCEDMNRGSGFFTVFSLSWQVRAFAVLEVCSIYVLIKYESRDSDLSLSALPHPASGSDSAPVCNLVSSPLSSSNLDLESANFFSQRAEQKWYLSPCL